MNSGNPNIVQLIRMMDDKDAVSKIAVQCWSAPCGGWFFEVIISNPCIHRIVRENLKKDD